MRDLPLAFELFHVFKVGAKRNIEVVEAVWQVLLVVVADDCVGHHADAELFVARDEATPDALLIVVEEIDWLSADHVFSCPLRISFLARKKALGTLLFFLGVLLLFFLQSG